MSDDVFRLIDEDPETVRDRLAAIVRSADDAIFSKNTDGIITSWNRAAERLYGYTEKEMVGRSISILVPSDRPGEEREILAKILSGEELDHYETKRVTKDGRVIDVSISASPIHASGGSIVGASVIARDISGARRARSLSDRLAAIIRGSDDAIYSKDAQAIVDSWNPAAERLYGYSAEEVLGRHIRFLVPLDRKGEETEILNRILSGERIERYETQRLRKSGDIVDVSITVSPIHDETGRVIGASVIARDIGEIRRREKLARSLDRAEFIARAAHELRTPVASLVGFASMLAADASMPDDQRKQVAEAVTRQGDRVSTLVKDLLDLSYVETGRYAMELGPARVGRAVIEALEMAPPPQGTVVETDDVEDVVAHGDPVRLVQVLVNLLTNAYKYGGERVSLSAREEGGSVCIEIVDDGPGVPQEIAQTLFDPFVRGSRDSSGAGLGLAISLRLIEAQGGEIHLAPSVAGARFIIELPAASSKEGDTAETG